VKIEFNTGQSVTLTQKALHDTHCTALKAPARNTNPRAANCPMISATMKINAACLFENCQRCSADYSPNVGNTNRPSADALSRKGIDSVAALRTIARRYTTVVIMCSTRIAVEILLAPR